MIHRIAEFFDRIERERPQLFRAATSGWTLLALGAVAVAVCYSAGLFGG